jgi:hypothetical protein
MDTMISSMHGYDGPLHGYVVAMTDAKKTAVDEFLLETIMKPGIEEVL